MLDAKQFAGMAREEMMHTTTYTQKEPEIDNTEHMVDPKLLTNSEDEMKVWGYLMTQYNLKLGLKEIWSKGAKCSHRRTHTAARHGHMDSNGRHTAEQRRQNEGTVIATVLKRETNGKD